jgi:hypothetical protein
LVSNSRRFMSPKSASLFDHLENGGKSTARKYVHVFMFYMYMYMYIYIYIYTHTTHTHSM